MFIEFLHFIKKIKNILFLSVCLATVTQAYAFGTNGTNPTQPIPQATNFSGNGTYTLGNGVTCEIRIQVADVLHSSGMSSAFTFVRLFGPSSFYGGAVGGGWYSSPDMGGGWNTQSNYLASNKSAIENACGWTPGSMTVSSEVRNGTSFSTSTEITTTFSYAYGGGLYEYSGGITAAAAGARASISNSLTYVGPYVAAVAPDAPTIGNTTAGDGQASVVFTAPASNGGAAINSYSSTCTSSNGGTTRTASGSTSPIIVSGLTNGKDYTCTVTATNSAGTGSASSTSNTVTPMGTQTITFASPSAQNFGSSPTLSATSTSSLAVSFTSSTTSVCTITSGGNLTFVTTGTCTIDADQAGNSSFLAASTVSRSFAINAVAPGAPTIGLTTFGNGQASAAFTAPASNGGAAISSYTATCTSSNGGATGTGTGSSSPITVTGLTNGKNYTCTVTATNSAATGAASAASNSVTPIGTQTITFANPGAQNFGTTPSLSATSTSSLAVSFTSSTTGVCAITSGGNLTFVNIGACTIDADQAGNSTYLAASTVTQSFTVNAVVPGAPTIGNTTAGIGQATVAFAAPASDGRAAISSYTATCTSSNGGALGTASGSGSPLIVTGLTNGKNYTCTVTATNSVGTGPASSASSSLTALSPIPTMSEWAMMLMASLMVMLAVLRFRKHQI